MEEARVTRRPPLLQNIAPERMQLCLEALLDLSLQAETVLDPEEHARHALDRLVMLMSAERGYLFLCHEEGTEVVVPHGHPQEAIFSNTIINRVLQDRVPIMTLEASSDPRFAATPSVESGGLRSVMAVPLLAQNRLLGAVWLDNRVQVAAFKADDLAMVQALGTHIAHSMETARAARLRLQVQTERQQRRLADTLREVTLRLTATRRPDEVLQRLVEGLAQVVPHDGHEVFLLDRNPDLPAWYRVVAASGQTQLREQPASLAVPLLREDHSIGLVVLHRQNGSFTPHEVGLASAFSAHGGIALENAYLFARVEEMATVDQLTGVWNRRHLLAEAEQEFVRARRQRTGLSILMLDVDHFKQFNDTWGHDVGDAVLREVAHRCRRSLREIDVFGRYGGEEFAAILPGNPLPVQRAEAVREAVSQPLRVESVGELQVTASLGVADLTEDTPNLQVLLKRADAALYAAKAAGRNCVRTA
ncbi:MAG: GGDEF domain-containing protein [Candidatus Xenobia bacterium]